MTTTARAIYDYEARASDELSFKRHDVIEVLGRDDEDEGWYRGVLNGRTGLFPNNYVQFQEAAKVVDLEAAATPAKTPTPAAALPPRCTTYASQTPAPSAANATLPD